VLVKSKTRGEAVLHTTFEGQRDGAIALENLTSMAWEIGLHDLPNRVSSDEVCMVAVSIDAAGKVGVLEHGAGDAAFLLQVSVAVGDRRAAGELHQHSRQVAFNWLHVLLIGRRRGPRRRVRRQSYPRPELLPDLAQVEGAPAGDEVDDRAVVLVVSHREIDPVPVPLITGNNLLIAGRPAHRYTIAAAVLPVEDIPLHARILGQVDAAFEQVQLFASVRMYAYSLKRGRAVGDKNEGFTFPWVRCRGMR
jgi:hypothetical protein